MAGLFAIGAEPTGSSDPFGLRRAAAGLLAILRAPAGLLLAGLLLAAFHQISGRSCTVWSRRAPTPTAATGAPILSSSALT